MNWVLSILLGVFSSLIAFLLVEAHIRGRHRYYLRAIRGILPNASGKCTVVCPAIESEGGWFSRGLLSYDDATAFAYAISLANKTRLNIEIMSSGKAAREVGSALVCIGGPEVNRLTDSMLTRYFPGFIRRSEGMELVVQCGDCEYRHSDSASYAFIMRLSSTTSDLDGSVLLLWGIESIGTVAAAYYFAEKVAELYREFGKRDFAISIRLDPRLGYKALPRKHTDLTGPACTEPEAKDSPTPLG